MDRRHILSAMILTRCQDCALILQGGYIGHLFSSNADIRNAAASVGSHFILNNLFHFAFVMLFVRSHFILAEMIIIFNWFNLSSLYHRHNTYPRFIHAPVVSGPLAWTFVAIFWNGAMMVYHPITWLLVFSATFSSGPSFSMACSSSPSTRLVHASGTFL